ncbi:MAG TPA: two-component system response regulator [Sulfurimonas sp. UBA12504]|nr:MAG: two-component system response regulator [Sulfurimonas sp. GWF2_37_8]DAB29010.1 MAG TPA: two-component system response regulator [Sulfurimonas sp. UBA12504]
MNTVNVLAVDDEPFNLDLIELAFLDTPFVKLTQAINGKDALEKLSLMNAEVVLLDIRMPVMDGLETLEKIKSDPRFANIPIIMVTANSEEKHKALRMGANDFLSKPVDVEELKLRTFNQASLYKTQQELKELNKNLDSLVEKRTYELRNALVHAKETEYEISLRLGRASEYRDLETGMHIKRMSRYSALLGKLSGMNEEEEELLLYSSPLHDIGKIGIPDAILLKPGKLDNNEFRLMQEHTRIGALMLDEGEKYPIIQTGKIIALQHHEKHDGSGYPNGLKDEEININARIVAIADVFDALSSKRVYKDAFPLEKTLQILQEGRGTHFDPVLLDLFIDNIALFLEIQQVFPDTEEKPHILNILEEYR